MSTKKKPSPGAAARPGQPGNPQRPPARPPQQQRTGDPEANAISSCLEALRPLQPEARHRVMQYVGVRFKLEQQQTPGIETVSGADEGARTIGAAG